MVFVCNNGNQKNHSNRSTIYNQWLINSGTSSYSQTFVNGSPGINDQLIKNGNDGFDYLVICNEDAAMYSQAMHNDDIDLDEYTLWDLLGVASSASMNQKQIRVALLGFISFFKSPINGANFVLCPDGGTKSRKWGWEWP